MTNDDKASCARCHCTIDIPPFPTYGFPSCITKLSWNFYFYRTRSNDKREEFLSFMAILTLRLIFHGGILPVFMGVKLAFKRDGSNLIIFTEKFHRPFFAECWKLSFHEPFKYFEHPFCFITSISQFSQLLKLVFQTINMNYMKSSLLPAIICESILSLCASINLIISTKIARLGILNFHVFS